MRKKIFLGAAIVLGGLLALRVYQEAGEGAESGPPGFGKGGGGKGGGARAQLVEAVSPERTKIRERVSLVGSLRAIQRVEVTPRVSGRVVEMMVDRGDAVRRGQVIARLEDDEIRQQVRRAEASLQLASASVAQREAELAGRRLEYERLDDLANDGVVSTQMLEQSQTSLRVSEAQTNVAKAQVSQAEAELEELRIRLSQTTVLSPLTGVVGERHIDVGGLVSSTTPIVLVLDLSTMKTVVNVPEREITKLEVGDRANVQVDAVAGSAFEGHVTRISPLLDSQTRSAPVEIELQNTNGTLKAEMFARVDLNLQTEREALLVPRDALIYRSNRPGVFIVEGELVRFQTISAGVTEGDRIEVVAGLDESDTIVAKGANLLRNGDPVRIMHPEGD